MLIWVARTDLKGGQSHADKKFDELLQLQIVESSGVPRLANYSIADWIDATTEPDKATMQTADWNTKAWLRVGAAWSFLQAKLIITDRLHAHLLSTLWQKVCNPLSLKLEY